MSFFPGNSYETRYMNTECLNWKGFNEKSPWLTKKKE